jgi:hypothetical protein
VARGFENRGQGRSTLRKSVHFRLRLVSAPRKEHFFAVFYFFSKYSPMEWLGRMEPLVVWVFGINLGAW